MKTREQLLQQHFDKGGSVVIALREKHSDAHFACHTLEEFSNAILEILWRRFHEGYWYYKPEKPKKASISLDETKKLPDGPTKDAAIQEHSDYKRCLEEYDREKEEFNDIKEALETRNIWLALGVLEYRSDYEYEGIVVRQTTPVKLPNGNLLKIKPKYLED
ncbi:unnamed protein product [marine sediment metagenome]|uniref:Uncharacterized protein n=1 Tax=marine sediment metagenome TaxID=412755 RepID=X0VYB7_9ZZZZ